MPSPLKVISALTTPPPLRCLGIAGVRPFSIERSGGAMGGPTGESGTMSRWLFGRGCLPTLRLRV